MSVATLTCMSYPSWSYYPRNVRPPAWVGDFVAAVGSVESDINTAAPRVGHTSDVVLQHLAPGLRLLGFAVEAGRAAAGRIRRPVLFGDDGRPEVTYDIDAFHDQHGI